MAMTEDKKKTKPLTEKKKETNNKYLNKLDDIKIRVPLGYKKVIKEYAESQGFSSVNQLVIQLILADAKSKGIDLEIPSGIREVNAKEKAEN